jgi:hypothetical protein
VHANSIPANKNYETANTKNCTALLCKILCSIPPANKQYETTNTTNTTKTQQEELCCTAA